MTDRFANQLFTPAHSVNCLRYEEISVQIQRKYQQAFATSFFCRRTTHMRDIRHPRPSG